MGVLIIAMLLFLKFCLYCLYHCYPAVPPQARLLEAMLGSHLGVCIIFLYFSSFPLPLLSLCLNTSMLLHLK